jgi:GTPase
VTQAETAPPTFVVFATGRLEAAYTRYLERELRARFGFSGTPIRVAPRGGS